MGLLKLSLRVLGSFSLAGGSLRPATPNGNCSFPIRRGRLGRAGSVLECKGWRHDVRIKVVPIRDHLLQSAFYGWLRLHLRQTIGAHGSSALSRQAELGGQGGISLNLGVARVLSERLPHSRPSLAKGLKSRMGGPKLRG